MPQIGCEFAPAHPPSWKTATPGRGEVTLIARANAGEGSEELPEVACYQIYHQRGRSAGETLIWNLLIIFHISVKLPQRINEFGSSEAARGVPRH